MSISRPWRGRGGSHHAGRLRIAVAKILTKHFGWQVFPEDIKPVTGRPRSDWRQDIYRWELFTYKDRPRCNQPVVLGCWETLTEFYARARVDGMHVFKDEIYGGRDPGKSTKLVDILPELE